VAPKIFPEEDLFTEADADELEPLQRQQRSTPSWLAGKQGVLVGIGIGIVIAAGGILLVPRLTRNTAEPQAGTPTAASAQSVTVATVASGPVASTLEATGTVAASDLLPVLPRATGVQIQEVRVDEGDAVQAGQVMAVLDDSVLQAQLNQAQAQVSAAQAVVRQRQAAVAQARATLAEAQSNRSRYTGLAREGAISRQELESRTTTAATAQEQVRLAQADVSSAQAEVESRRAQVQQLQTQLEQTLVRTPAAGIVAERIARVGDVTNGTQKLFSIIRDGVLELQVKLPASQLPRVKVGAPVRITTSADERIRLQATVREIAPLVDPQNRQATVEIDLPATNLLRPGMFVQAEIVSGRTQGLTVPAEAVLREQGKTFVYRLDRDRAKAQPVEVGETMGNTTAANVAIKQGLEAGDRVVLKGAGFLKDGDRVRVVAEPDIGKSPNPAAAGTE